MMTPEQAELVATSWEAIAPRREEVGRLFYEVLFRRHPELRAMFGRTDLAAQQAKFVGMVDAIIALRGDARGMVRASVALSERHAGYGVVREQYAPAGSALLTALEMALGPALTPELRDAWAEGYELISAIMCRGAERMEGRPGAV